MGWGIGGDGGGETSDDLRSHFGSRLARAFLPHAHPPAGAPVGVCCAAAAGAGREEGRPRSRPPAMATVAPQETDPVRLEEMRIHLPVSIKNLLACLRCRVIKTKEQFVRDGCPNCKDVVDMRAEEGRVVACTTANFRGFVSIMRPGSFVSRFNGLDKRLPGTYALTVHGEIPAYILNESEMEPMPQPRTARSAAPGSRASAAPGSRPAVAGPPTPAAPGDPPKKPAKGKAKAAKQAPEPDSPEPSESAAESDAELGAAARAALASVGAFSPMPSPAPPASPAPPRDADDLFKPELPGVKRSLPEDEPVEAEKRPKLASEAPPAAAAAAPAAAPPAGPPTPALAAEGEELKDLDEELEALLQSLAPS